MMQHNETPNPKQEGRALALYAIGILSFTAVVLTIAAVIGAHRAGRPMPLGTPIPDEGHMHVPAFSSFTNAHHPPSSGPHYIEALKVRFYSTPVSEGSYVHNLEHGYIVVLFKRTVNGAVLAEQLQDLPDRFPVGKYGGVKLIVAPYDDMDAPIVALAWDRELPMNVVSRDQLLGFYRQYVDRGPEDVP